MLRSLGSVLPVTGANGQGSLADARHPSFSTDGLAGSRNHCKADSASDPSVARRADACRSDSARRAQAGVRWNLLGLISDADCLRP